MVFHRPILSLRKTTARTFARTLSAQLRHHGRERLRRRHRADRALHRHLAFVWADRKRFVVRVSDRQTWVRFLRAYKLSDDRISEFLSIIDILERVGVDETKRRVAAFGVDWYSVSVMLDSSAYPQDFSADLNSVIDGLGARGLSAYIERDFSLVRGLAYYTGTVFEVFDRGGKLRAIAGGGRYDNLIRQLSDGAVSMPALGFAMGDVVLGELLREIPAARLQMHNESQWDLWIDVYIVIAKEERR